MFFTPCPVRSASFSPSFIEKKTKTTKKSQALRDDYSSSILIENIRAFLPTFRAEKEIYAGSLGRIIFFKVTSVYLFFIENIRDMIKNGIPAQI